MSRRWRRKPGAPEKSKTRQDDSPGVHGGGASSGLAWEYRRTVRSHRVDYRATWSDATSLEYYRTIPQWTEATLANESAWTTWTTSEVVYRPQDVRITSLGDDARSHYHLGPSTLTVNQVHPAVDPAVAQAVREREARERERLRLADERWRAADLRARHLLDSLLTDEQRTQMRTRGYFQVVGSRGRLYRIVTRHDSMAGNVLWVDSSGRVLGRFCCHPLGVPVADGWATQMLNLRFDEDHFLATANLSSGRRPEPGRRTAAVVAVEALLGVGEREGAAA